ncbi:M23 family metallopeptidase [Oscillospiraceae bacterium LTW-04]|nr:M23 family metallopeptidase [Oscillospiraceae bacterium MB24-C1]
MHIRTVRHDSFAPIVKIETPGNLILAAKSDGTGVEWVSSANYSSRCEWYAERIYRIEKVPGFTQGIEFFSAKTMSNMPNVQRTSTYSLEDGFVDDSWLGGVDFLYMCCYGEQAFNNASSLQLYGNMYGALYSSSAYDGKFHPGIDINAGYGTNIMTPVGGTVVHVGPEYPPNKNNFGRLTIRGDDGFYYTFLHLSGFEVSKRQIVEAGKLIGHEGNTGLGLEGQKGSHLHFEISNVDAYSSISASSFAPLGNTYYPYDICYSFI